MDPKRNLKIKTGVVKRLIKDVKFYRAEKTKFETELQRQREQQADKAAIKRTQEFLSESLAVDANTNANLHNAVMDLIQALDSARLQGLLETQEYKDAAVMAEEGSQTLEGGGQAGAGEDKKGVAPAPAPAAAVSTEEKKEVSQEQRKEPFRVAVFGSSRVVEGDELYATALDLGKQLGAHGFHTITGGYCGTMEAISEGAALTKGAIVEGIIAPSTFPHRGPGGNKHLTVTTPTDSLGDRITLFTKKAEAYVVLPGNTGTLTELMLVWNVSIVNPFSKKARLPIFLWRKPWEAVIKSIGEGIGVPKADLDLLVFVDGVDDVVKHLQAVRQAALGKQ